MAATIRSLPLCTRPSEVWRSAAFALLRLNPKECEALALVFEDESVTDETRILVLDLLAGAGTFEAQVVIRRLLALSVARRSNRTFATFVQRLGFVECPDGPTLRFLMSVYAESRNEPHDVRSACAYALGAAAGQAFAAGDPDAAVRASDVIRRDLVSASSVMEKCALLTALGNAGVPSDMMVISRFTLDVEAPVRASSALALRKMTTVPEACTHLVSMLADREIKVAQSALLALADHKLNDDELERLAELVLGGRTSLAIDARVLRLLVAQRPRMTACPGRAGAIENALRLLLGRVEAAALEPTGSGERRVAFPPMPMMSQSGSVRAMPAAQAHPYESATKPSAPAPSMAAIPAPPPPRPMHSSAPMRAAARTEMGVGLPLPSASASANLAATVVDPPMTSSGHYRMVNPGDSVETVRARMIQMGLDPNARMSIIPQPPPPRRASGHAPVAAPQTALMQPLQQNATVRKR